MSKQDKPVTLQRDGKTKTVRSPEDIVKAKFDGWQVAKPKAKAPEPRSESK